MESANRGERRYTLDEKSAGLQKGNRYGDFEGLNRAGWWCAE